MGFTALDGLPMGTRPGQLDPGVVLYLMSEKGMSASKRAGLSLSRLRPEGTVRRQQRHARARGAATIQRAKLGDRLFRLPDRAQRRHAGRRIAGPRCLRLHGRHRRELRQHPRAHRRAARMARRRARSGRECTPCAADIALRQPRSGLCRADRRGTDDRAAHVVAADEQTSRPTPDRRGRHEFPYFPRPRSR